MTGVLNDREAYRALLSGRPIRQAGSFESTLFYPSVIPDSIARAFVIEAGSRFGEYAGGIDMFGVDWEFVPQVGGSTVRPGHPKLYDINDWPTVLNWPNVDKWDWNGSALKNRDFFDESKFNTMAFMNGWFERLVSLMDFSAAVMALIDEDQTDAVKAFFDKLTDTYIDILDRSIQCYPKIDGFWIHDDWGGQLNTFFSPETCNEMIVPYMKRVTDFLHAKGKHCDFHSCGNLARQIPNMIAAGWDSWTPQPSANDIEAIYDQYGDQLMIGITCNWPDPEADETVQRQAVRQFVEKYCHKQKPCLLNVERSKRISPLINEEVKKQSAAKFASDS